MVLILPYDKVQNEIQRHTISRVHAAGSSELEEVCRHAACVFYIYTHTTTHIHTHNSRIYVYMCVYEAHACSGAPSNVCGRMRTVSEIPCNMLQLKRHWGRKRWAALHASVLEQGGLPACPGAQVPWGLGLGTRFREGLVCCTPGGARCPPLAAPWTRTCWPPRLPSTRVH